MRRICIITVVLLVGCGGCIELGTSEERLVWLEQQADKFEAASKQLDDHIELIRHVVADVNDQMGDPNLLPDQLASLREQVLRGVEKLGEVKAQKQKVDDVLANIKAAITAAHEGGATIGDELQAYGSGAKAVGSALPPPFNAYAIGIGAILSAIGGTAVVQKKRDKAVLEDVVKSVDALLSRADSGGITSADEAKKILKKQKSATRRAVDAIRAA